MIQRQLTFFRKAWESIKRAPVLSASTMAMLAVVFLLFGAYGLIAVNVEAAAERWIGAVRLCVFLQDDTGEAQALAIAQEIKSRGEVKEVRYVSRAEAKARFLLDFPGDRSILEGLPENPLPASLEVELVPEAQNLDQLSALAERFRAISGVEDAIFGRELFNKLTALATALHIAGGLLGVALALAVLFLSANTIRLNIYARREEIAILQMVGATRAFLRMPFLIEGVLQGLAGAALSLVMLWAIFAMSSESLSRMLSGPFGTPELRFFSTAQLLLVLATGALLGLIGSAVAVGRNWSDL